MQYCVRVLAVLKQHMPPTAHAVTASTAVACHSAAEDTDTVPDTAISHSSQVIGARDMAVPSPAWPLVFWLNAADARGHSPAPVVLIAGPQALEHIPAQHRCAAPRPPSVTRR